MNKKQTPQTKVGEFIVAFGESLARSRVSAGVSQVGMAEQLGLTRDEYEGAERGERDLDMREARQAAMKVSVPLSRLVAAAEAQLREHRTLLVDLVSPASATSDDELAFVARGYGRLTDTDQRRAIRELLKAYLGEPGD